MASVQNTNIPGATNAIYVFKQQLVQIVVFESATTRIFISHQMLHFNFKVQISLKITAFVAEHNVKVNNTNNEAEII